MSECACVFNHLQTTYRDRQRAGSAFKGYRPLDSLQMLKNIISYPKSITSTSCRPLTSDNTTVTLSVKLSSVVHLNAFPVCIMSLYGARIGTVLEWSWTDPHRWAGQMASPEGRQPEALQVWVCICAGMKDYLTPEKNILLTFGLSHSRKYSWDCPSDVVPMISNTKKMSSSQFHKWKLCDWFL